MTVYSAHDLKAREGPVSTRPDSARPHTELLRVFPMDHQSENFILN